MGIGNAMYAFASLDAVIHVAEEMQNPSKEIPRAMLVDCPLPTRSSDALTCAKEPHNYYRTRHSPSIYHCDDVRHQGPRCRPELCPSKPRALLSGYRAQGRCDCSSVRLVGSLLQSVVPPSGRVPDLMGVNWCYSLHAESVDYLRPVGVGLLARRSSPDLHFRPSLANRI